MLVRRAILRISVALATMGILACAPVPKQPPRPPPARPPPRPACPLGVEDATVVAENTADGIALIFTSSSHVQDLRERGRDAAKLHGPFGRLGKGHDDRHGGGSHHGLQAGALPQARASAEDIEGGVRVTLVPLDPSELESLRTRATARANKIATTPCDT